MRATERRNREERWRSTEGRDKGSDREETGEVTEGRGSKRRAEEGKEGRRETEGHRGDKRL